MKRSFVPGIIDVTRVSDADEIRKLVEDQRLDRKFDSRWPLLNAVFLRRVLQALSFGGHRFPTLRAREDDERAGNQSALWNQLNRRAAALNAANPDVGSLAQWVVGSGSDEELGILTQQAIGRLFVETYTSDSESWKAARLLASAPQAKGLSKFSPRFRRKVVRAKELLAAKVNGDLAGVHGTGVAIHNVVKGFHRMRQLYRDITVRKQASADAIVAECLSAPAMVLRQATENGSAPGCPYRKGAIFLLELAAAQTKANAMDMVFLERAWSRCPADRWVPALFQSVWKSANIGNP